MTVMHNSITDPPPGPCCWQMKGSRRMRTGRNRGEEISSRIWRMPVRKGSDHLETGDPGIFPHCNGAEGCGDSWIVKDHRTEERSISTSGI